MVDEALDAEKRAVRRAVRARLRALSPPALLAAGEVVAAHLAPLLPAAGALVALFASRDDELSTAPLDALLRARRLRRCLPRVEGPDLAFVVVADDVPVHGLPRDGLGIHTPAEGPVVALADCALVIVPGLAFDADGGRLGYGRGYYDRALTGVADDVVVGVLCDAQWVERVPMGPHDRRLRRLVGEGGVVVCGGRSG